MRNFVSLFILLLVLAGCSNKKESAYIFNEGAIFGTYYHLTYEQPKGENLHEAVRKELNKLDLSLSTYKTESTLSKVNSNREVKLDDYFVEVFQKSVEISKVSKGAFDATVAPLVNAWGFGFTKREMVTPSMIDSIKQFVGYEKVRLQKGSVKKEDSRVMLDFSAIAKGYAVDKIGELLTKNDCANYMVEIGGEVRAKGVNNQGRIWRIGINEPNENEPAVPNRFQAIVDLKDKAIATSGNYRNFYVENGKKYAHTIDPETGYPVNHSLLSATVIADDCMTADAFATGFMVMGLDKSKELIQKLDGIEVFLIFADEDGENQLLMTSGFKRFVED